MISNRLAKLQTEVLQSVFALRREVYRELIGSDAKLVKSKSKYNGRMGRVTGFTIADDGEMLLLLMIYNLREPDKFLNSDPETRSYRHIWELDFGKVGK